MLYRLPRAAAVLVARPAGRCSARQQAASASRAGLRLPRPRRARRQRGLETWHRGRRMHRNCLRLRAGDDGAAAPVASVPLGKGTDPRNALPLGIGRPGTPLVFNFLPVYCYCVYIPLATIFGYYLIYADCRTRSLYNQRQEPWHQPVSLSTMRRPK